MNQIIELSSQQFQGIAGRSNVEGMYSARRELWCRTVYFIKKIERSDSILRNSAVRYSAVLRFAFLWFCGSPFNSAASRRIIMNFLVTRNTQPVTRNP